jgi:hypothetical protein
MLVFEQGEMRWEGWYFHGWWEVLESSKDLFLGVDPQDNVCRHIFDTE